MKTALIFGATGQDGSYLAELLLGKGYRVIGVARRTSTANTGRLRAAIGHNNFTLAAGDVTDPLSVHRLVADFDPANQGDPEGRYEIYNLAAQSHVGTSFHEPLHTTQVTYGGCLNVLEAVRNRFGGVCHHVRVYQASSSEMFGSSYSVPTPTGELHGTWGPGQPLPEGARQHEGTPMLPNSPYAVAKLAAHHAVRIYRNAYGVYACSGVLFNHESERRGDDFVTKKVARWVASLYREIKRRCPAYPRMGNLAPLTAEPGLRLRLGNFDAARDWGFAGDYVKAMWLMLQQREPQDFVVATGEAHTVLDLVTEALSVIGYPSSPCWDGVTLKDMVVSDPKLCRPCEVPYLRGDASRARGVLNWRPEVSFKELVARMVYAELNA